MQSVHFTTKVVSSNSVHGDAHSIQHYVIKYVSELRQVDGFLRAFRFPPPIKLTATVREHLSSSPVFFVLSYYVSLLSEFRCDICYEFRIKRMFGSSLPPVVCMRARVLLTMFCSSLPPVVCRRAHVLLTIFGSSLPPVVCRRAHVLLTLFGSSLPPVVCRRAHVLLTLFGSSLPTVVCRSAHVLFTSFVFL